MGNINSPYTQFNSAAKAQPWKFYTITMDGLSLPNWAYKVLVKSIQLYSIYGNEYSIRVWTKPYITLKQSEVVYYNWGSNVGAIFWDNINANLITLSKKQKAKILANKINELNNELKQINIDNTNPCGFNDSYIKQALSLAKYEALYISEFSSNNQIKSAVNNLLSKIESKNFWMLKYLQRYWDASSIYGTFKSLIQQMQHFYYYESNLLLILEQQNFLKKKITNLSNEVNQIQNAGNAGNENGYGFNTEFVNEALKLSQNEKNYLWNLNPILDVSSQAVSLWNNINNKYQWMMKYESWDWYAGSINTEFISLVNQLQGYYKYISSGEKGQIFAIKEGLNQMKSTKMAAEKYASEMKGIAIASSVATGIGIALAATYWVSAFFDFGATIPDAIAARASAAATTVAMGCMWASYSETNELAKKKKLREELLIEHII